MRNHRSHLRADDGQVWTYLCLPYRVPAQPIPPSQNDHMLRVEGRPARYATAFIEARTEQFYRDIDERVRLSRIARGVDPVTGD